MGHLPEAPQTIVIFRALQLGDLLCTVPAFRSLRFAYPKAHITLVGLPWAASFAERFSHYLDAFIEFPGWPGLPELEPKTALIPGFLQMIQQRDFDLALQMQGSGLVTNPLVQLFNAQQTAGYFAPGQYQPNECHFQAYPEGEHEIRIWLRLMESIGVPAQGEHLEFPIQAGEQERYEQFRKEYGLDAGAYICLHPGARYAGRRWAPEKFAAVGDALADRGYRIVLTGSAAEQSLTEAVANRMCTPVLDAAGQTEIGTLALLLANARLLISNDTGVSHMAAAMQTPSVILFTVSDPNRWRPLNQNLNRIILNSSQADHQDVLDEVEDLLREEYAGERRSA